MTEAAILVTRHHVVARSGESGPHLGDEARYHHGVDVGIGEQESMYDMVAGQAELHRRIRRHYDASRHEIILLAYEPHCDRAVGLQRRPQVALNELAFEMKRPRIDHLDIAGRMQPADKGG